ncbi:MAG: peptidylprolyl isomerase [Pseudomonadota bacterium]
MRNLLPSLAALPLVCAVSAVAVQDQEVAPPPSPGQIVAQAAAEEWIAIAASDLLVMELAPDREGNERRVIIQLMPPPFSQGWVRNIRKLAAAKWWDGTSVNRVQDNYVVQWGDADYDNPESEGEAKSLPEDLEVVPESEYLQPKAQELFVMTEPGIPEPDPFQPIVDPITPIPADKDAYSEAAGFWKGWPLGADARRLGSTWPVHCYGMVGVGRNLSPDTGTGAELYTVIGHAPRHLDRNIALVARIIEGIEHLSSLPRGKGQLGFYEDPARRVPITSIRLVSALPEADQPRFEYLDTEAETFARYAEARANRRDPFFNVPAGGADICNIPVPVRRVTESGE